MMNFEQYLCILLFISVESEARRLRLHLENWKLILLEVKDVLLWQKQWHPIAILGGTTVLFILLWLFEPSNLSLISLIGLLITMCDYFGLSILSSLLRHNANRDIEFDQICTKLVIYKRKIESSYLMYLQMRRDKPKMFYFLTITILATLAYIGCTFNNLFLAYLLVNFTLLLPGIEYNGFLKNFYDTSYKIFDNIKQNDRIRVNGIKKGN